MVRLGQRHGGSDHGVTTRAQSIRQLPPGGENGELLTAEGDGTSFWGTPPTVAGSLYVLSGAASADGLAYTATNADFAGVAGSILVFLCPTDNTGNATLNVSGEGAKSLLTNGGAQIAAGLLQGGRFYIVRRQSGTQYRVLNVDITKSETTINLFRGGAERAQIALTALNEITVESWIDGAQREAWRIDAETGHLRSFYKVGTGATAAKFAEYFGPHNPPTVIEDDAHAVAMAKTVSDAATREYADQLDTYTLSTTDPYCLNGGDSLRTIRVTVAGAHIDAQFAPIGGTIEIAANGSGTFDIYCGPDNQWRGFAANQKTLAYTTNQIVQVKRYSATDFFAYVLSGSAATPSTADPVTRDITIVNAGQSNGVKFITEGGLAGLQQGFADLGITDTVWFVQAASGESALIMGNEGTVDNYWWEPGVGPGPLATALVAAVTAAIALGQPAPEALFWDQGERDSLPMATTGDTTPATYLAAMEDLFTWFRAPAQLNNATLPIFITPLGSSDLGSTFDPGVTAVREAQLKYIASDANAHQNAERYDLSRPYSNVHLNYAGQREQGLRVAKVLGNVLYSQTNDLGPEIVSWTETDPTTFVAIVDPGDNDSMENDDNPIQALGFAVVSNLDAMSCVHYELESFTRFFNEGTGMHEFTFVTTAAASGARLIYPNGALAQGRTGRFIKGTVSGLPLRSWNSTP
jgi:hypothetical protein